MTFKINHEKTNQQITIQKTIIQKIVKLVFPKSKLLSYEVISGGCANFNIKIMLDDVQVPYILRIYMRDKDAAFREQKIGDFLKDIVPIPQIYAIGDYNNYRFAITTFIKGMTLRDLLLSNTPHDIKSLMTKAGFYLSKIQKIQFESAGFFDKDLNVMPFDTANTEHDFIKKCLKNTIVLKHIGDEHCAKITYYVDAYKDVLIDLNEKSLVHGDYDPANILVDLIDNHWKITGILDWEFAFSGSFLQDVANMLRYAHHMPTIYEESFLQSLKENNVLLPENWRIKTHLLNIGSLLDCFIRHPAEERPNQSADIVNLITFFIHKLDEFHEKKH